MKKRTTTLIVAALLCCVSSQSRGQSLLSLEGDSISPISAYAHYMQFNARQNKKATSYRMIGYNSTFEGEFFDSAWIQMLAGRGTNSVITKDHNFNYPENAHKNLQYDSLILWIKDNQNPTVPKLKSLTGYEFNSAGLATQYTMDFRLGETKAINLYTYDPQGRLVRDERINWQLATNSWKEASKIYYNYNATGLEMIVTTFTGTWDTVHVTTEIHSNNGQVDSSYRKSKVNSNGTKIWIPYEAHAYVYNSAGLLLEDKFYKYDYTIPGMYLYHTESKTYTANNDMNYHARYRNRDQYYEFAYHYYYTGSTLDSFYHEKYSNLTKALEPYYKIFYSNSNGHLETELWQGYYQNGWVEHYRFEYRTDANNNLDSLIQYRKPLGNPWEEKTRTKFYYEQYFPSSSPTLDAQQPLLVYPNPARNEIHIKLSSPVSGQAVISLYAMDGSRVFRDFQVIEQELSIKPQLKPGLYLYQISIAGETYSGRVRFE